MSSTKSALVHNLKVKIETKQKRIEDTLWKLAEAVVSCLRSVNSGESHPRRSVPSVFDQLRQAGSATWHPTAVLV